MATVEPTVAIASVDPEFAPKLCERLISDYCRVIVVKNMRRLAERIRETEIHVAVVDLDLTYGSCRDLLEELRSLDKHLGLIIVADHCSQEDEIYLRSNGVMYLAFKPAEPARLAPIVEESARNVAKKRCF